MPPRNNAVTLLLGYFGAAGVRRGTKPVPRKENTTSPRWLVPVLRIWTMPHSGRESEARTLSTSLTKLMVSPAITGLIQRSSRKPGDGPPATTGSPQKPLQARDHQLHADGCDMPAGSSKPAEQRLAALLLGQMKTLR